MVILYYFEPQHLSTTVDRFFFFVSSSPLNCSLCCKEVDRLHKELGRCLNCNQVKSGFVWIAAYDTCKVHDMWLKLGSFIFIHFSIAAGYEIFICASG